MKKGTIYRNLWAGHETYFVYQGAVPTRGVSSRQSWGWGLVRLDDRWKLSRGNYYTRDLENDREHFPVAGHVDMDKVMVDAILSAIGRGNDGA